VSPDWTGGIYASPSIAGSRPGGLIVGAWAAMMHMGLRGYREAGDKIMQAAEAIRRGYVSLGSIPHGFCNQ
jgi:sphinganine-1-phosphate aldolase